MILKKDGTKTTLRDQLQALRKNISPNLQAQIYEQVFLNGTTGSS